MGEAPPAPGLSRRPPKQADQQVTQVSSLHRAALPDVASHASDC